MRVDRVYLDDFKNLKKFSVDFDVTSPRQVVVGRNGVGKSNLLEALIWIFRDLDFGNQGDSLHNSVFLLESQRTGKVA